MNARLEKIKIAANRRDLEIVNENRKRQMHLADLKAQIRTLAPRMHELLNTARALYENGFPLGPKCGDFGLSTQFVSNGWSHRVGFIRAYRINDRILKVNEEYPLGFGIEGGGCAGKSLEINEDGELVWLTNPIGEKPIGVGEAQLTDQEIAHLERFVNEFDDFERGFYEYVDNL